MGYFSSELCMCTVMNGEWACAWDGHEFASKRSHGVLLQAPKNSLVEIRKREMVEGESVALLGELAVAPFTGENQKHRGGNGKQNRKRINRIKRPLNHKSSLCTFEKLDLKLVKQTPHFLRNVLQDAT